MVDINIPLDIQLQRHQFIADAQRIQTLASTKLILAALPAHGLTTLYYIARKVLGAQVPLGAAQRLLAIYDIAPVNRAVLLAAAKKGGSDFEDDVVLAAAEAWGSGYLVTRDPKGFSRAAIKVLGPSEFLVEYEKERLRQLALDEEE